MTQVQVIAVPVLLVWLVVETLWDFRDQNIPRWFSLVPLTSGFVHLAWVGNWLAAILMMVSILGTNLSSQGRYFVVIAPTIVVAFLPGLLPLAIGWLLLYWAWELGWMGAADSLAGAYLLVWFPSWEILTSIVFGILVWNVGMGLTRYGGKIGLRIWVTTSTQSEGTRIPGMGAFALALGLCAVIL